MKYLGIQNISSKFKKQSMFKYKNLHFFTCTFLCLLIFSCFNISVIKTVGLADFIKKVTCSWTPKTEDFGKIKFVNFSFDSNNADGVFVVSSPFKNYYVQNISSTELLVSGLGDVVVLSPIDGIVQSIKYNNGKCNISIVAGSIIANLISIDYACVSVGDSVKTGDKIAVSLNSEIKFSLLCNGEYIQLYSGGLGDTFFE